MPRIDFLKLGDKVQIEHDGIMHNVMIEGVPEDDVFLLSEMWHKRRRVMLRVDDIIGVACRTKSDLVIFDAVVIGFTTVEQFRFTVVRALTNPIRFQRRDAFRAQVMLDVEVTEKPPKDAEEAREPLSLTTKTIDVSETGLMFMSKHEFQIGSKITVSLDINKFGITSPPIVLEAEVVRVLPPTWPGDPMRIGVRFTLCPEPTRRKLAKFIMKSQVKT